MNTPIRINNGSIENFSPHLGGLKCGVMGVIRFDHRQLHRHLPHLGPRSSNRDDRFIRSRVKSHAPHLQSASGMKFRPQEREWIDLWK